MKRLKSLHEMEVKAAYDPSIIRHLEFLENTPQKITIEYVTPLFLMSPRGWAVIVEGRSEIEGHFSNFRLQQYEELPELEVEIVPVGDKI